MGIFNRKKEEVIVRQETESVEGAEVWMVSWNARYGSFMSDVKRVAKAFLTRMTLTPLSNHCIRQLNCCSTMKILELKRKGKSNGYCQII